MKSESNKSFKQGFVLNEQELRRLYDVCCQQMKSTTKDIGFASNFELKFQNGVIATPASLDEILIQENMGSSAIRRLGFNLSGNDSRYKISIQFIDPSKEDDDDGGKSIKYKIEGEDRDWVFVTSSQIDERIGRIKSFSLSSSVYRNIPIVLMQILLIIFMIFGLSNNSQSERLNMLETKWNSKEIVDLGQLIIAIEKSKTENQNFGRIFQSWTGLIFTIGIVAMAILLFGEKLITYLFPQYNFLWGDYIKFYESQKSKRNFVLVVVVLGLVLSVVANYIYSFLTGK